MASVNMTPHEGEEQATLFNWARMQSWKWPELELMYHIPNGGKRSKSEAARFKAEGVKSGVPDIFLPVARGGYHGLYIELKRLRGNSATENQNAWIERLRAQGYRAEVCKGWEAARKVITEYMESGTRTVK